MYVLLVHVCHFPIYNRSELAMAKVVAEQYAMERQVAEVSSVCKKLLPTSGVFI